MLKPKLPKPKTPKLQPPPSTKTLTLLKQCQSLPSIKQIHSHLITSSIHHPNHLLSKIIELKDLPYSILLFSQIPHPNDFSYNIIIRALATTWKNYPLAFEFYVKMIRSGEKPNKYTYPFVLIASANAPSLYFGRAAHCSVVKDGLEPDCHARHSLITMYAKCGELGFARQVFDEICERDLVSWNSMISGYSQMGFAREAVGLFRRMGAEGFEPNEMTLVSVLSACGDLGELNLGKEVEGLVEASGLELNSFMGSALVNMYGKCGDLKEARRVFDGMPKRDLEVWNAMITGYAQNGLSDEAISLFQVMREARVKPDKITVVGVISACASVGALDLGLWLDTFASRNGLHQNVYVGTALIDMHAKCGNLDRAIEIFYAMRQKNTISWNAMISALASHGRGQEAISLFSDMLDEGIIPDDITFVGLLSACVHAGLVEEGRRWFDSMESMFRIIPQIEHYSCMVDLLARAGHVEAAWEFIEKMPEKPDAVVLGSLLCACRNCKNVEIGEKVAERILEVEPLNSGNYVISSKIYASSKRWDDSARMRGLMRERGVSKTPGRSWVEVDGQVCQFHAGDALDLRAVEIHRIIEVLVEEMKLEGYTPNIDLL